MRRILLLYLLLWSGVRADDAVLIPAGEFVMGSDDGHFDENPPHRVKVDAFYMDRLEVTNAQFAEFVRKTGYFDELEGFYIRYYAPGCGELIAHYENRYGCTFEQRKQVKPIDLARWRAAMTALRAAPNGDFDHFPVRGVTWRDAAAYARWAGKRLPTEAEWERAARGAKGTKYPWGNEWDATRCRAGLQPSDGPVAVGSLPEGASSFGCLDMAGNVWEWCADWYGEFYYAESDGAENPTGPVGLPDGRMPTMGSGTNLLRTVKQGRETDTRKVIRGGSWSGALNAHAVFNTRCARRLWSNPTYAHPDVGFRCARDVEPRPVDGK